MTVVDDTLRHILLISDWQIQALFRWRSRWVCIEISHAYNQKV